MRVSCPSGGAVNTQLAWLGQNLVSFLAASEAYSINPAGDRKSAPQMCQNIPAHDNVPQL